MQGLLEYVLKLMGRKILKIPTRIVMK